MTFTIPEVACQWRFVHASGPGGQHVNKTSTAVELRLTLSRLGLPPGALQRLKQRERQRINQEGELIIRAEQFRSQLRNREDALRRALGLIEPALTPPKKRIATKPSRAAKERRMNTKKKRGDVKANRRKPSW